MTVLRSDIERALDDLISNEEGMRFQGLAVVLAKQRWPDLVASERKKDLGADAIGSGKVLACSLTGTLGKLKSDAAKIRDKCCDVTTIIFATAQRVSNTMGQSWAKEIEQDFQYDLVVMSREDIVTSLMDPSNAGLCRAHLGLHLAIEASAAETIAKVRDATAESIVGWSRRLAGKPLIELRAVKVDKKGGDAAELFALPDICKSLTRGSRVVIEAPAGRGKTTTLSQLATRQNEAGGLAFLVDFPGWIRSGKGLLQFIADSRAFQARGLKAEALAQLEATEPFSFLLNGWNEVEEAESIGGARALSELERDFPSAGILVATRTHHIVPPLPGASRLRLLPVNRTERAQYLQDRLHDRANELLRILEDDPVLDDLTQTPLILAEVADLFEAGQPLPKAKMAVLDAAIRLHEGREEHSSQLSSPPLSNRAGKYLAALSEEMTEQGAVTLSDDAGRATVSSVATSLRSAGQISALPEPSAIVNTLCAHHILERVLYPAAGVRFEHQQFQEFYVASMLKRRLERLATGGAVQEIQQFTRKYVNQPAWTEPLRMIAEEIGVASAAAPDDRNITNSGTVLVLEAMRCDPVFAGELSYLTGPLVWKEVGARVKDRLLSLYASGDGTEREISLAAMLATGSPDFGEILLPLLTSDDQQIRLSTYRSWSDFHLAILGADWPKIVSSWPEDVRAEFVSEMIHSGNAAREMTPFALSDPSQKVRVAAISALPWAVSREAVAEVLQDLNQETLEAALEELPAQTIPASARSHALAAYEKFYSESSDPVRRLELLLHTVELGATGIEERLKEELAKCGAEQAKQLSGYHLKPVLEMLKAVDPQWVSNWVAERIADNVLWHEHWVTYVETIPDGLRERLLLPLESEDLKHARFGGGISVLAASADPGLVKRVFVRLCDLQRTIAGDPDQRHESEWAIARQLEDLFRLIPVKVAVEGLLPMISDDVDAVEMMVVSGLFSRVGRESYRTAQGTGHRPESEASELPAAVRPCNAQGGGFFWQAQSGSGLSTCACRRGRRHDAYAGADPERYPTGQNRSRGTGNRRPGQTRKWRGHELCRLACTCTGLSRPRLRLEVTP